MKRSMGIIVVCLILVGCGTKTMETEIDQTVADYQAPENYVKYENKKEKFEIYYPQKWSKGGMLNNATVVFKSPAESKQDTTRENCNVVTAKLPQKLSLDRYQEISQQQLKRMMTDFTTHGNDRIKLRGRDAYRNEFSHRMGEMRFRVYQYLTLHEMRVYSVTCTAGLESFDRYRDKFDRIAGTFAYY